MEEKENIIKATCKELNINQKDLAEKIGISEGTLNNISSTGKITKQIEKALELLIDNERMKKDFEIIEQFKQLLNKKWDYSHKN